MNVAEPLLRKSSSNSWRLRLSVFTFLALISFLGVWVYRKRFLDGEQEVGIELPGTMLDGCKVITGVYIEHYKGFLSKEIHVAQKGCMGRDIEIGSKFIVYGDTVTMSDLKGEIKEDGSIHWVDGQVWTPLNLKTTTTLTPSLAPTSLNATASAPTPSCENISGAYEEIQEDGEVSGQHIQFLQTGCTGFDYNKIPFTVVGHTVSMNYQGTLTEGQIHEDGVIEWSNGFIHRPKLSIGALKKTASIVDTIKKSTKD